ncbi:hypothetical protein [Neisseria subflava]|uniref:hypothetical protein n=1 Tax=Neisseria subflava TaxID=28449 RepID=UPI0020B8A133|nr:hypothetical protein [Neisseria subflava]
MKKTAAVIAAGLLLAACTATQNTAENSPAAQSVQNPTWDKQYGGADKSYDSRLLALRQQRAKKCSTTCTRRKTSNPAANTRW